MYSQVTPPPVTPAWVTLSGALPSLQTGLQTGPQTGFQAGLQGAGADAHARYLAEALANIGDQAKTIRTPIAFASDVLAEALLQRRLGQSTRETQGLSPQAAPAPSPSPGVPPPSAPGGTANAAPAASSPVAGAAVAPLAPAQLALQATPVPSPSPTLVDALKAYVRGALAPAGQVQDQDPGSP